jgi:hypothetical protein
MPLANLLGKILDLIDWLSRRKAPPALARVQEVRST